MYRIVADRVPEKRAAKACIVLIAVLAWSTAPAAAEQLRIVTWNVTNYSSGRVADFQTALYAQFDGRSLAPDVFAGQEFLSSTGVTNFLAILNGAPGSPGDWAAADFVNGPDTDSAFFYRTSRVELATDLSPNGVTVVATGGPAPNHPRHIMRYDILLRPGTLVESRLAIYSSHMKAGSGGTDQDRRLLEAQRIRDDAESLPEGWHFLIGGDFNIQSSSQDAYVELVGSQSDNTGRFTDPIRTPGSWNNASAYRIVHTQDPSGAGGMDDRHDQILVSSSLVDGLEYDYIGNPAITYSRRTWDDPNHSYRSWGNDGTSFNQSLTIEGNEMVGAAIAQALVRSASGGGHLPVFLDLYLVSCLADADCDGDTDLDDYASFASCLSGPVDGPSYTLPSQGCLDSFDFDGDTDVDLEDAAELARAFSP